MKIRTAVFGLYGALTGLGFVLLLMLVFREVRVASFAAQRLMQAETARLVAGQVGERWQSGASLERASRLALVGVPDDAPAVVVSSPEAEVVALAGSAFGAGEFRLASEKAGYGSMPAADQASLQASVVAGDWVWVQARIDGPQGQRAWVSVGRPLGGLREAITLGRVRVAAIAALVLGVLIVSGAWLAGRLSGALERLVVHVDQVRGGARSVFRGSRADEINALAAAFEHLRSELEGRAYVERYVQALTHELKSPVTAIASSAELLAEDPPAEARGRFLATILAESRRIGRLAERLLALSAVENRRVLGQEAQELEAGALLENVAVRRRPGAELAGVDLAVDPGTLGGMVLRGDRDLLVDAIGQLVANAVEFSPAGGRVRLALERHAEGIAFVVEDEGPGVPPFALGRVFERFFSLPRPDTGRKSSGLGLAFAAEVAALHGGRVTLANREGGKGAVANFILNSAAG